MTFVTNNAISSTETIKTKLSLNNFDPTMEVINPATAIIAYLKSINYKKMLYAIVSKEFKQELIKEGFLLAPEPVSTWIMSFIFNNKMSTVGEMKKNISPVIRDFCLTK